MAFSGLEEKEKRTHMLTARIRPSVLSVLNKIRNKTSRSYADIIEHAVEQVYGKKAKSGKPRRDRDDI